MALRLILLSGAALLPFVALPPALAQPLDDSPRAMLLLARGAVDRGRIDAAREALERAETRLLGGAAGGEAAASPPVPDIVSARRALDRRDGPAARASMDRALVTASSQAASPPPPGAPDLPGVASTPLPPIAAPPAPGVVAGEAAPPPVPMVTRALRAGRWELRQSGYVWVPPDTVLRPVEAAARGAPRWVWDGAEYRLLPQQVPTP